MSKFDIKISWDEIRLRRDEFVLATYVLDGPTGGNRASEVFEAARQLAIGQSVGNPNVRSIWETDELFEKHSARIVVDAYSPTPGHMREYNDSSYTTIAFPVVNTDWEDDGISHLLCQIMGGQLDIDVVTRCYLAKLSIPDWIKQKHFGKPAMGLSGLRYRTGSISKPLLGGIIKPKTGISPQTLLDMTKELVDGGVDFIKEDEILSNPAFCPLKDRVPLIANYLSRAGYRGIYNFCINADPHAVLKRAKFVSQNAGPECGVHVNFWSGLGVYNSIRKENPALFIHFQKSGDKILTSPSHKFHISWSVIQQLAAMMGVDSIHSGMIGGYMPGEEYTVLEDVKMLVKSNVIPALSCGMNPGLVDYINKKAGNDWLANVGGALHGHPGGTLAGVMAMRQAIDGTHSNEFISAIKTWGYKKP
jgi:ribulose 1,5-bisphosphate carboxylase large subunit-like protein